MRSGRLSRARGHALALDVVDGHSLITAPRRSSTTTGCDGWWKRQNVRADGFQSRLPTKVATKTQREVVVATTKGSKTRSVSCVDGRESGWEGASGETQGQWKGDDDDGEVDGRFQEGNVRRRTLFEGE